MAQTTKVLGFEKQGGDYKLTSSPLSELGPRDILVQVEATAGNPADYKKKNEGHFLGPISAQNPGVVGFDAAGVVQKVGSEVSLFKVGDEVYYSGDATKLGSYSQYQVVDERIVGKKPKNLSWAQAASIPLVGLTAYEGLAEVLGIKEADRASNGNKTLLIVGAAGGVGSILTQIAKKLFGLKVIATASRPETVAYSKKNGADIVINHKNNLAEELKAQGIQTVNYVYNTNDMTAAYFDKLVLLLDIDGGIVGISGFTEPLNLQQTFFKRIKVATECMFTKSYFGYNRISQHTILNHLAACYEAGTLVHNAEIIKPFSPKSLAEADIVSQAGQNIGKIAFSGVQDYFKSAK